MLNENEKTKYARPTMFNWFSLSSVRLTIFTKEVIFQNRPSKLMEMGFKIEDAIAVGIRLIQLTNGEKCKYHWSLEDLRNVNLSRAHLLNPKFTSVGELSVFADSAYADSLRNATFDANEDEEEENDDEGEEVNNDEEHVVSSFVDMRVSESQAQKQITDLIKQKMTQGKRPDKIDDATLKELASRSAVNVISAFNIKGIDLIGGDLNRLIELSPLGYTVDVFMREGMTKDDLLMAKMSLENWKNIFKLKKAHVGKEYWNLQNADFIMLSTKGWTCKALQDIGWVKSEKAYNEFINPKQEKEHTPPEVKQPESYSAIGYIASTLASSSSASATTNAPTSGKRVIKNKKHTPIVYNTVL
jgi:hypothetical protein